MVYLYIGIYIGNNGLPTGIHRQQWSWSTYSGIHKQQWSTYWYTQATMVYLQEAHIVAKIVYLLVYVDNKGLPLGIYWQQITPVKRSRAQLVQSIQSADC